MDDDIPLETLVEFCLGEDTYQDIAPVIAEKITKNPRQNVQKLCQILSQYLDNPNVEPVHKFLALRLIKDCMDTKTQLMIDTTAQRILDILADLSKKDKKSIFRQNYNNEIASNFQQLLLECITEWANEFGIDKKTKNPSKYKQVYDTLVNQKVKFPENRKFFASKNKSPKIDKGLNQSTPNGGTNGVGNGNTRGGPQTSQVNSNKNVVEKLKKALSVLDIFIENILTMEYADDAAIHNIQKECKNIDTDLRNIIDTNENLEEATLDALFQTKEIVYVLCQNCITYLKAKTDLGFINLKNSMRDIIHQINNIKKTLLDRFGIKIKLMNEPQQFEATPPKQENISPPKRNNIEKKPSEKPSRVDKTDSALNKPIKEKPQVQEKSQFQEKPQAQEQPHFDNFNFDFGFPSQNDQDKKEQPKKAYQEAPNPKKEVISKPEPIADTQMQKFNNPEIKKNEPKDFFGFEDKKSSNDNPPSKQREPSPFVEPYERTIQFSKQLRGEGLQFNPELRPTATASTTGNTGSKYQRQGEIVNNQGSNETDDFEPVDINYLLENINKVSDDAKSYEELQNERDSISKMAENLKRNQGILDVEQNYLSKDMNEKTKEISSLKQELIKLRNRHLEVTSKANNLKNQNSMLLRKKQDLLQNKQKVENEYYENEKKLKIVENGLTEDEIQEQKLRLKNKTIELDMILKNQEEQLAILRKAIDKINSEQGIVSDNMYKLRTTPMTNGYFNKVYDSPGSNFNPYIAGSGKDSTLFVSSNANAYTSPNKLYKSDIETDLLNGYNLIERSKNMRNGGGLGQNLLATPQIQNTLKFKDSSTNDDFSNNQDKLINQIDLANKKKPSQSIIYDEPFFNTLSKRIDSCNLIPSINSFKMSCLQKDSVFLETDFLIVQQSSNLIANSNEFKIKFIYENKSQSDIQNMTINIPSFYNLKSSTDLRNVNLNPKRSLTQTFSCRIDDIRLELPHIDLSFTIEGKKVQSQIIIPLTINKFLTFQRFAIDDFVNAWKRLRQNQIRINDRNINQHLFGNFNDIKNLFSNAIVKKNMKAKGKIVLALVFELPFSQTHYMEIALYNNFQKFDIKIEADVLNYSQIAMILQTLAFLIGN